MKILVYIWLFFVGVNIFVPQMDVMELTKLPHLISHYHANHDGISLWNFIVNHVQNNHEDEHDSKHENLPFHHHQGHMHCYAYMHEIQNLNFNQIINFEELSFYDRYSNQYFSHDYAMIFLPPKIV